MRCDTPTYMKAIKAPLLQTFTYTHIQENEDDETQGLTKHTKCQRKAMVSINSDTNQRQNPVSNDNRKSKFWHAVKILGT